MTKLNRVTGKVFGGDATATGDNPEIGQFGSALAGTYNGTTDVATIQSLPAWGQGWAGAVTPDTNFPALPEMTGFGKVLSYQNNYVLQSGIPEWDSDTIYYTNNFCRVENVLYYSLTDENQGNNPTTDTTNWATYAPTGGSSTTTGDYGYIIKMTGLTFGTFSTDGGTVPVTANAGIKCLFPDGINDDGTAKYIEYTLKDTCTATSNPMYIYRRYIAFLTENSIITVPQYNTLMLSKSSYLPSTLDYSTSVASAYVAEKNLWYYSPAVSSSSDTRTWTQIRMCPVARVETPDSVGNNLTYYSFYPTKPLTIYDGYIIPRWGKIVNKYITLEFGPTGTVYTAPEAGYIYAFRQATASNQYIQLQLYYTTSDIRAFSFQNIAAANADILTTYVPVNRGDRVRLTDNASGLTRGIRFYYTAGTGY